MRRGGGRRCGELLGGGEEKGWWFRRLDGLSRTLHEQLGEAVGEVWGVGLGVMGMLGGSGGGWVGV